MSELKRKALFNAAGDIEVTKRRMINGNTTNPVSYTHLDSGLSQYAGSNEAAYIGSKRVV